MATDTVSLLEKLQVCALRSSGSRAACSSNSLSARLLSSGVGSCLHKLSEPGRPGSPRTGWMSANRSDCSIGDECDIYANGSHSRYIVDCSADEQGLKSCR
jgi:hypothetical protein